MKRNSASEKYNDDFKKTIVELYHSGSSVKALSSEYGVSEVTIYKWVKGFTPIGSEKESLTLKELAGIHSITRKRYRPFPSQEKVVQLDNLLKRDFTTCTINEKWVADITYIPTVKDGWCYLASVLDLYSKKIIGYSFSHSMTSELVIDALQNVCFLKRPRRAYFFIRILAHNIGALNLLSMFNNRESRSLLARKAVLKIMSVSNRFMPF